MPVVQTDRYTRGDVARLWSPDPQRYEWVDVVSPSDRRWKAQIQRGSAEVPVLEAGVWSYAWGDGEVRHVTVEELPLRPWENKTPLAILTLNRDDFETVIVWLAETRLVAFGYRGGTVDRVLELSAKQVGEAIEEVKQVWGIGVAEITGIR